MQIKMKLFMCFSEKKVSSLRLPNWEGLIKKIY